MAQKSSDWLQIPLYAEFHVGRFGIDYDGQGVETWEARFGTQVDHLLWVCSRLGVNVFKLAGLDIEVEGC